MTQHVPAECALTHALEERSGDLHIDVCLEQGQPYLAQRFPDVVFGKATETTEAFEDLVQPVAESLEHKFPHKT